MHHFSNKKTKQITYIIFVTLTAINLAQTRISRVLQTEKKGSRDHMPWAPVWTGDLLLKENTRLQ